MSGTHYLPLLITKKNLLSDTEGYEQFGRDDQNVIAVGLAYNIIINDEN